MIPSFEGSQSRPNDFQSEAGIPTFESHGNARRIILSILGPCLRVKARGRDKIWRAVGAPLCHTTEHCSQSFMSHSTSGCYNIDRCVSYFDFLSLLRGARQPERQPVITLMMFVKRCHLAFSLKIATRDLASYGQHYDSGSTLIQKLSIPLFLYIDIGRKRQNAPRD